MNMRIGYGKFGKVLKLSPDNLAMTGDVEGPNTLRRLAHMYPDVEWVVVGKHDGDAAFAAARFPANVTDAWAGRTDRNCKICTNRKGCDTEHTVMLPEITALDGLVLQVGQHGTSSSRIGSVADRNDLVEPLLMARHYGEFLVRGMNAMQDRTNGDAPVVWLCPDPRNYMKARDVKWPNRPGRPILAQYTFKRTGKHERYGDTRSPAELGYPDTRWVSKGVWEAPHEYVQSGLEFMSLTSDWHTWGKPEFDARKPFGIATTATWAGNPFDRRSSYVKAMYEALGPSNIEVFGAWDDKSKAEVAPLEIQLNHPSEFQSLLESWRCTVSLPPTARGAGQRKWVAAKPWQAMAARSVCFMLGEIDAQGWVVPNIMRDAPAKSVAPGLWSVRSDWTEDELTLARWLRCATPADLVTKIALVAHDQALWHSLVDAQTKLLWRRWEARELEHLVGKQLGLEA